MFEAGIHNEKLHIQKAIEIIKSARKAKDLSNERHQTATEIQSAKSEMSAEKDTCNEVQKTNAEMKNKMTSFEETSEILNTNVTFKCHEKESSCHGAAKHKKSTTQTSEKQQGKRGHYERQHKQPKEQPSNQKKVFRTRPMKKTDIRLPQQPKQSTIGVRQRTGRDRRP